MKKLLLPSLLLFLLPNAGFAQHQRLAIPRQQSFTLEKGQTHRVQAFCLDHQVFASSEPVPYNEVLTDSDGVLVKVGSKPPITLDQAIRGGSVTISGSSDSRFSLGTGLSIRFHSNVVEPLTFIFKDALAMGEKPGSKVDPHSEIMDAVRTPPSSMTPKQKQDWVWEKQAGERRLQTLGYYDPSLVVNPENTRAAVLRFQSARGLDSTGIFDNITRQRLADEETQAMDDLETVGFPMEYYSKSKIKALSYPLRGYQKYLGLEETGVFDSTLHSHLASDVETTKELKLLLQRSDSADSLLTGDSHKGVITYRRFGDGIGALVNSPAGPELWFTTSTKASRGGAGELAFERFAQLESRAIEDYSINTPDDTIVIHAGPTIRHEISISGVSLFDIKVPPSEMEAFLTTKTGLDSLDELFNSDDFDKSSKIKVVVTRSALEQARAREQLAKLSVSQTDSVSFAKAFTRQYGDRADVFLVNDPKLGLENLTKIPKFTKGADLTVYVDGQRIDDMGTIFTQEGRLKEAGIQVIEAKEGPSGKGSVVLIVGKDTQNYRDVVKELADKGAFKGYVLALAKCGTGGEAVFNSDIISRSGARAVIFYDQLINAQAVEDVLMTFTRLLQTEGVPDANFRSVWLHAVDAVAASADGNYKTEVLKLREALIQLSFLLRSDSSLNC